MPDFAAAPSLGAPPAFRPTRAQRRLLDLLDAHPSFQSVHQICQSAGIGRASYYRWCHDPQFRLWLASAWCARLIVMDGLSLLNFARANAARSFPYWNALFKLIFDPNGLASLQLWQQACALAPAAAFDLVSRPDPPASGRGAPGAPSPVSPLAPSNQPDALQNETILPAEAAPLFAARAAPRPLPATSFAPPRPNRLARHLQHAFAPRRARQPARVAPLALRAKPARKAAKSPASDEARPPRGNAGLEPRGPQPCLA
ncbi:MAG: hypothetical protein ACRD1E_13500 [Terriglobales bacterium]